VISLRYHVITIVAVFLALAVGLLAGSAFVEPGLVDQLREQTDRLRGDVRDLDDQLSASREESAGLEAFAGAALPYLTENRLLGADVILVAQEGVEDAVLGETQRALADAGATVLAVLSARDQLATKDPETQARLAELIGATGAPPEELPGLAAAALAERLATGSGGATSDEDLLARLLSDGFLAPVGSGLSEATLAEIGSDGQVVVVLGGSPDAEPEVPPETFAAPLVRELSGRGVRVAAGESSTTPVSFVDLVRDGGADGMVTVDDLDLSIGAAALVMGLDRLLLTGEGGAYGLGDGAQPLPPPS
jgi:hypothetical protein